MTYRTDIRTYALDTELVQLSPWGTYVGGRAQCADGVVRKLKRISSTADTFYSVPASVTVNGRTVAGYVTLETVNGLSTPTDGDPLVVRFVPYRYRKNSHMLPYWPPSGERDTLWT